MSRGRRVAAVVALGVSASLGLGCDDDEADKPSEGGQASAVAPGASGEPEGEKPFEGRPLSNVEVDHGELATPTPEGAPQIASIVVAATIYKLPNVDSRRLGYIRIGQKVPRDAEPVKGKGCKEEWYRIYPLGFVCTEETTIDMEHPIVRAAFHGPELDHPLPYDYGFVRATAPQYLRIPTKEQQIKSEFKLEEHLQWFAEHSAEVQTVILGANDVPLDSRGVAVPGLKHPPGFVPSTSLTRGQMFGAESDDDPAPFWLEGNDRKIPNVSSFKVPDYAIFADRVRRKTGLSFVGSFDSKSEDMERRFAVTVDLRLIPTTKVKPDTGSPFHGIELGSEMHFPFAWVLDDDVTTWSLIQGKDEARPGATVPRRAIVPLTGKARIKEGKRFYQTLKDKTVWLRGRDLGIVHPPEEWPAVADAGEKWIDISVGEQTLVLYEGKAAKYATLISSGRDRFGDPKKDLTTPLGDFRLQSKHIAAAMDSEENSTVSGGKKVGHAPSIDPEAKATIARLKAAKKAGKTLSKQDERRWTNIEKGRHPEYGVTRRRGAAGFELRDVPWIQYFSAGYALHGAYWHDVFGTPRSHGCVNLAPIDARIVFNWTDPPVPEGWHGINVGSDMGEGTAVHVRK